MSKWDLKNPCDHQNSREISPGYLHPSDLCNPNRMNIFATHDKRYRTCVNRSGEVSSGNLLASYFLQTIVISSTHHRNLKYNDGQEVSNMPTRPCDTSQQEISNFSTCEQIADWIHNRSERISTTNHLLGLREERRDRQKIEHDANDAKLKGVFDDLGAPERPLVLRSKNIGS